MMVCTLGNFGTAIVVGACLGAGALAAVSVWFMNRKK